jgi:hypothetical protein
MLSATMTLAQRPPTAEQSIQGGTFEASGVVHIPGTNAVLFVDDGRDDAVFWMQLDESGRQQGPAQAITLGVRVVDPEGITTDGSWFYVIGSQSKRNSADGAALVRFRFDSAARRVSNIETVSGLRSALLAQLPAIAAASGKKADGFNIEGLAWDKKSGRILLGLRSPVIDGQALVLPLPIDATTPLLPRALVVREADVIRLPLGNAGIRSLEFDATRGAFRLITGSATAQDSQPFKLWQWSGESGTRAQLRSDSSFDARLKPEGVTSLSAPRHMTFLVFDTSRYLALD